MKFVYFVSTGKSDPTGASVPLHLAVNGSVEVGHDTTLVFGGDAADLFIDNAYENVEGLGVPPMRDLIKKARERTTIYI
jgi:predicted peroxiredoxin